MSAPALFPLTQLDARARDIFGSVVSAYLETGQPVGSKSIALSGTALSPASIRAVMADLTRMGLLESPHVSAGRQPTQAGLRLYVDGLLEIGDVSKDERRRLETRISASGREPDRVFSEASLLLAGLAGGAGLVLAPEPTIESALSHVEFVGLDDGRTLVVMVHEDGRVENRLMPRPDGVLSASLERAGNFLSARLRGRRLSEARADILDEIEQGRAAIDVAAAALIKQGLADWTDEPVKDRKLIIRGQARLLDNLDARTDVGADLERIRLLFEDLDRKEELISLLDQTEHADGVRIFIGTENPLFSLSSSSVVVAPYRDRSGKLLGALGVIGPTRLNYGRVIPVVDLTAKLVGEMLTRRT
ncbi:heat-inducible transcriptional repressor HrcA [uncultured Algimonas sp.]|uniref:heat-inducible transcriptional repressor HrcA n=1 Tax=uncultured Algimonas sp. TaxID=1547920 RepID=UPI002639CECE|nr:heat-inducible transcriptional repressor HrcA [uncultured Algimonas sp.]